MVYDEDSGQTLSGSFMDYNLPKADDLPIPRPITLARRRSEACTGCVRADLCGGHFAAYLDLHGDGELEAITEPGSGS